MAFSSFDTLDAQDLSILRTVLEDVCQERTFGLESPEAQEIARSLVDWYLFGVKDPAELRKMLDPLESDDSQQE